MFFVIYPKYLCPLEVVEVEKPVSKSRQNQKLFCYEKL